MSFIVSEKYISCCLSRISVPCWACRETSEGLKLFLPLLFPEDTRTLLMSKWFILTKRLMHVYTRHDQITFFNSNWVVVVHCHVRHEGASLLSPLLSSHSGERETQWLKQEELCFICVALLCFTLSAISQSSAHLSCPLNSPTFSYPHPLVLLLFAAFVPFIKVLSAPLLCAWGVNACRVFFTSLMSRIFSLYYHLPSPSSVHPGTLFLPRYLSISPCPPVIIFPPFWVLCVCVSSVVCPCSVCLVLRLCSLLLSLIKPDLCYLSPGAHTHTHTHTHTHPLNHPKSLPKQDVSSAYLQCVSVNLCVCLSLWISFHCTPCQGEIMHCQQKTSEEKCCFQYVCAHTHMNTQ